MDIQITVKEIKGYCPVYNLGDSMIIRKGYILDTQIIPSLCMHSLSSIMPYYVALSKGVSPGNLGLSGTDEGKIYLQCLDPHEMTGGGTVIFEASLIG